MHAQTATLHTCNTPLLPGKCETIPRRLDATEEEFDFGAGQLASTDKGFDSEMPVPPEVRNSQNIKAFKHYLKVIFY